jgi:SAM-dependent methyltransferase
VLTIAPTPALDAYEALAEAYDVLTAGYDYDHWLAVLEGLARAHGLEGDRLLDVACGTGKSFLPLLERGYAVTACDLSPAMAARAAEKAPEADVFVADMRDLDTAGEFDLLTCIDDSLNYLLEPEDLIRTFEGFRRNLRPGGIAVWDVNTLATYRSAFASDWVAESEGTFVAWKGLGTPDAEPGSLTAAQVDVFSRTGGCWDRRTGLHRQRHWPAAAVAGAARTAGLDVLAVHGQRRGAVIDPVADESAHSKMVFVGTRGGV